jgi:hypothetical protein
MDTPLDRELVTYGRERERLLASGEGKYVLIHGDEVVGVYDTQADAINEGYRHFGGQPFLAKEIVRVDVPLRMNSSLFAL